MAGFVDDADQGELVAAAAIEIVGVVCGRDFHHAGAELGIGEIVEDDGNRAVHQRELDALAVQIEIAGIGFVDGDGSIAQHRFGARGGDHDEAVRSDDRVADVPEMAVRFGVRDLQVRNGGEAARAPVDHVLAAIDGGLFSVEAERRLRARRGTGLRRG